MTPLLFHTATFFCSICNKQFQFCYVYRAISVINEQMCVIFIAKVSIMSRNVFRMYLIISCTHHRCFNDNTLLGTEVTLRASHELSRRRK